jgi:hypothetical protein
VVVAIGGERGSRGGGLLWGVNYWVCGVDLKWVVVAMCDNAYYLGEFGKRFLTSWKNYEFELSLPFLCGWRWRKKRK